MFFLRIVFKMFDPIVITDSKLQRLYDYWLGKHRDGRLPAKADIDPVEIPDLLMDIFLVDVVDGGADFVFKLAGSQVEEIYDGSLRGKSLFSMQDSTEITPVVQQYLDVVTQREPRYRDGDLRVFGKDRWLTRRLLLPLSSDGESVDVLLGGALHERSLKHRP